MQVTNGDIFRAKDALKELIKEPLPVKTAYWLTKLVRKANEVLRDIETVRVRLVEQYGVKGEDGNIAVVQGSEQHAQFMEAFEELLDEAVEIDGLPMDKISLPSDNGLCVTPAALMALDPFVEVA